MNTDNWKQMLSHAGCNRETTEKWSPYFAQYAKDYKITTVLRISAFLANVMAESHYLTALRENLNYSAKGLANTWPSRYSVTGKRGGAPNAKALAIAGNPEKIANHCYANRMGNGDEASGDGWRHSGKGPIQITGKTNFESFFRDNGLPLTTDTNLLTLPDLGVKSAMWYWNKANINVNADKPDFDGCCDKVNIGSKTRAIGDAHGYNTRLSIYNKLKDFLSHHPELLEDKPVSVLKASDMDKVVVPVDKLLEYDPDGEYQFEVVENIRKL